MITVAEARARGIGLPADDDAAQDIIDGEESYLARKIGPLVGERTETFYVGVGATHGKLALRRYTDAVVLTDGGVAYADFRMVDDGSSIIQTYAASSRWWTGPYVAATYTPNDEDDVRRALFDLVALAAEPTGSMSSEKIGDYSYTRSVSGGQTPAQLRAVIVGALLPKRDQAYTIIAASRPLGWGDPVINRAEVVW